jgi:hypothetical protein
MEFRVLIVKIRQYNHTAEINLYDEAKVAKVLFCSRSQKVEYAHKI